MASSPKAPTPVDPTTVINAQEQANRVGRVTPFGEQHYEGNNLVTTLPQGTQNAFNNISDMAGNKQQFMQSPNTGSLQNAILNKISARYSQPQGQGQKQGMGQMSPTGMHGGNVMPTQGAWNQMFSMLGQMPQGQMMPPQGQAPSQMPPPQTMPMLPPQATLPRQTT